MSGGDSLKALRLCEDIVTAVGGTSAELLEVILDGTFSDVLRHVVRVTTMLLLESSMSPKAKKRHVAALSAEPAKREHKGSSAAEETQAGKVTLAYEEINKKIRDPETNKNTQTDALGEKDAGEKCGCDALGLSLSWSSDTGRCVDASPVLLIKDRADQRSDEGKTTVFIGSHSHRIQALDLIDGSLLWERVLGGRIEASAAVSLCRSLVVVGQYQLSGCVKVSDCMSSAFWIYFWIFPGCYDGCVYFLCAESGRTRWAFKTGDAVKSGSPHRCGHSGLS